MAKPMTLICRSTGEVVSRANNLNTLIDAALRRDARRGVFPADRTMSVKTFASSYKILYRAIPDDGVPTLTEEVRHR